MKRRLAPLAFVVLAGSLCGCAGTPDDRFVADVRALRPSVVLLTMHVAPEKKSDGYDEAYGTGFVVASGAWGSDVLTVAHVVDGAWDLHVTIDNKRHAPARVIATNDDTDVALVRTPAANLPAVHLQAGRGLDAEIGREVGLLGYPIPDEFEDEKLGLATSVDSGRLSSIRNDAIEVTLQIIPGESGAPVFIADTARIIGLADSRFDDEHAIGFAVPIDDALALLHKADAQHGF